MKELKVTTKDLKDTRKLLQKAGAINGNIAYPEHVYISKEDAKIVKKNLTNLVKKEYPNLMKSKVTMTVGMEWLNLGPNQSLENAVRPGYILVDEDAIEAAKQQAVEKGIR